MLTGAAGFLGTELAARLAQLPGVKICALVRAADETEASRRLRAAWRHDQSLHDAVGERIIPVPGDFTQEHLGLSEQNRQQLRDQITLVIHAGAEIGFQKSRREFERTNVQGTANTLAFASGITGLRRFVYISTAYVSGCREGVIPEEAAEGSSFSNQYESSKARAEELVRKSALPFAICRPGMIAGDSRTGWAKNFNTVYYILKLMLLKRLPLLPLKPSASLNLIPVDYAADAIVKISFAEEAEGKTFHITCPRSAAPRAGELAEYVRDWARKNLALTLPKPLFLPLPFLKHLGLWYNKKERPGQRDS